MPSEDTDEVLGSFVDESTGKQLRLRGKWVPPGEEQPTPPRFDSVEVAHGDRWIPLQDYMDNVLPGAGGSGESPPLEDSIEDLRTLADKAQDDVEQRKAETDLSGVNPKHMALAEMQGKRDAFQKAWRLAISKREEAPDHDQ